MDLTTSQLADRLLVKPATVKRWCQQRRLVGAYLDGIGNRATWLIPETALEGFVRPTPRGRYAKRGG